jgi:hypothetical protein
LARRGVGLHGTRPAAGRVGGAVQGRGALGRAWELRGVKPAGSSRVAGSRGCAPGRSARSAGGGSRQGLRRASGESREKGERVSRVGEREERGRGSRGRRRLSKGAGRARGWNQGAERRPVRKGGGGWELRWAASGPRVRVCYFFLFPSLISKYNLNNP